MANQKVLVVDDEDTLRYALRRMLKPLAVDVVEASNGEEALEVFEEEQPDIVLLDIMMPKLNGFEVCERLKSDPQHRLTPIVFITSSSEQKNKLRGLELGCDDFVAKPFDRTELQARVRSLLRMKRYTDGLEEAETVLFALAKAIEGKDANTEGHCERLSVYAEKLGRRLGLAEEQLVALRRAGIVHDIGKVAVPETILLKAGPLTDAEFAVMKQHPIVGEDICRPMKSFRHVLPIIRHHHEKMDGSGYPDGLAGEDIPITARIMTVVDVFDALSTDRPYRAALAPEKVFEIMASEVSKGWWDPSVFEAFRQIIDEDGFDVDAIEAEVSLALEGRR